jgi:hypothetical protein
MMLLVFPLSVSSVHKVYGYPLQDAQGYAITGAHSQGFLGCHFAGVGDVSGDGIDDFIVGESGNVAGRVYLFYGRLDAVWTNLTTSDAQASFVGESTSDWFGRWTAGLGDVNGDGYADFAVSSMMNAEAGLRAGKVYIFFGRSNGDWGMDIPATQANVSITGEASDDRLGHGVYGIGDTNGDGYDDFIVSAFWNDDGGLDAGQLYLFLGRPSNQWLNTYSAADASASWIGTTGDALAVDASGVGDVNNDGFTDFAVGAFYNVSGDVCRKVYLILGSDTVTWSMDQPIAQANASLAGSIDSFLASIALSVDWIAGAGDVNNDGFDDLIFGAYEEDVEGAQSGQTYLFFGRPTEDWTHDMPFSAANASFVGLAADDYCGWCVDGVGDVNGDAFADIVISVPTEISFPGWSQDTGYVYLFLGNSTDTWAMNTTVADADYTFTSEQEHAGFGFHVQGIGDINNDGFDDFAIGAPEFDTSVFNVGKTYIILHYAYEPTTTPPPPFPGFPLAAIIIGLVVGLGLIVVLRRRRTVSH